MTSPLSPYMRIGAEQRLGSLRLDVSCELTDPWTVLFGPSGAGKSSLLRLIAGLPSQRGRPTAGQLIFRGQTLMDVGRGIWTPPAERGIGFVMQRPALFPHMDVAGNVGFGLRGVSRADRRRRAMEMLSLFSAEPLAKRKPKSLSGGERQRVALARALAPEPRMLLLDEPFTGLDAALKQSILANLIAWLGERQIPALYVSHDVVEAFETGADVIVLRDGAVEAQGAARMVLAEERERLLRRLDGPRADGRRWSEARPFSDE